MTQMGRERLTQIGLSEKTEVDKEKLLELFRGDYQWLTDNMNHPNTVSLQQGMVFISRAGQDQAVSLTFFSNTPDSLSTRLRLQISESGIEISLTQCKGNKSGDQSKTTSTYSTEKLVDEDWKELTPWLQQIGSLVQGLKTSHRSSHDNSIL